LRDSLRTVSSGREQSWYMQRIPTFAQSSATNCAGPVPVKSVKIM